MKSINCPEWERENTKDNVVINGGLESGDKVVTTRLELMFEGMKVELSDG